MSLGVGEEFGEKFEFLIDAQVNLSPDHGIYTESRENLAKKVGNFNVWESVGKMKCQRIQEVIRDKFWRFELRHKNIACKEIRKDFGRTFGEFNRCTGKSFKNITSKRVQKKICKKVWCL